MATITQRITKALAQEFIEGTVYRIDLDRVDVAPDGSSGIMRSLPLTGDRDKVKPGDPIKIITIAGERVALAGDVALTDTSEVIIEDASEVELAEAMNKQGRGQVVSEVASSSSSSSGGSSGPAGNQIIRESFTATAAQTAYTLANIPDTGTELVHWNGILQKKTTDYTISTKTITTVFSPAAGDIIDVVYTSAFAPSNVVNADTLDGLHAAASGANAHVLATDANGDISVSHILSSAGVGARIYNNVDQSTPTSAWQTIFMPYVAFDDRPTGVASHINASYTSRLYCRVTGLYVIVGAVGHDPNFTGSRGVQLVLNAGAAILAVNLVSHIPSGYVAPIQVTAIYKLNAGDWIEMQAYQDSGGALNSKYLAGMCPYLSLARVA